MKARNLFLCLCTLITATSCNYQTIVPKSVNTVNSVSLKELNLERKDYSILNTVTAEATVVYSELNYGKMRKIECPEDDFSMVFVPVIVKEGGKKVMQWTGQAKGIAKLGYLTNDYQYTDVPANPEEVARRLAIYKIINMAKLEGADGVIEPIVSTNVDNGGRKNSRSIIFKTSVSAKLIKLKSNK